MAAWICLVVFLCMFIFAGTREFSSQKVTFFQRLYEGINEPEIKLQLIIFGVCAGIAGMILSILVLVF